MMIFSDRPRPCTRARDSIAHMSLIHVPAVCEDIEVQKFLASKFLDFRPKSRGARVTARGLLRAARKRFGDWRCNSILYYEH
jgi:hypothetical protein